jgi:hypothetical protein
LISPATATLSVTFPHAKTLTARGQKARSVNFLHPIQLDLRKIKGKLSRHGTFGGKRC